MQDDNKEIIGYNKYNWIPIKIEYVEGYDDKENNHIWPTMSQLAKRHGVPPVYLRKIASENKWTESKKAFLIKYEQIVELERVKQLAKRATNFDKRCIALAEKGIKEVENILCPEYPLLDEKGNEVKYSIDDLETAAKILDKFQKIGRTSFGLNNSNKSDKGTGRTLSDALIIIEEQMSSKTKNNLEKEFIGDD